jgi:hypothetical protein
LRFEIVPASATESASTKTTGKSSSSASGPLRKILARTQAHGRKPFLFFSFAGRYSSIT